MCRRIFKVGVISVVALFIASHLLFGREAFSYLRSSARSMRSAAQDSVPIEFQLRRARDLVNDIVPEIQANIRAVATQEVEIEHLKADIEQSENSLAGEKVRVGKLRDCLASTQASFSFGDRAYSREQLKDDLARRFEEVKEADIVLAGKQRLLSNREKALDAAMQMLDKARSQKAILESQIASLDAQNKLIHAAAIGSSLQIDNSKLAQSQRLIDDIKKQLDISERVISREGKFTEPIQIDTVSERDLVTQVDAYLAEKTETAAK